MTTQPLKPSWKSGEVQIFLGVLATGLVEKLSGAHLLGENFDVAAFGSLLLVIARSGIKMIREWRNQPRAEVPADRSEIDAIKKDYQDLRGDLNRLLQYLESRNDQTTGPDPAGADAGRLRAVRQ